VVLKTKVGRKWLLKGANPPTDAPQVLLPQSANTKVDILLKTHMEHTYNPKYAYLAELDQRPSFNKNYVHIKC
jgi:hypothetical protein